MLQLIVTSEELIDSNEMISKKKDFFSNSWFTAGYAMRDHLFDSLDSI